MRYDKQNGTIAVMYLIVAAILVPLSAWLFKAQSLEAAILTVSVTILIGGATWIFQRESIEFSRLAQRPSLIVDRAKLQENKIIQIENKDQKVAANVYVGSFLFSENGNESIILYDEIAPALVQGYPIAQNDVLQPDFRASLAAEDIQRYGADLRTRLTRFFAIQRPKFFLVIAMRNRLMAPEDTALFFFAGRINASTDFSSFSFDSNHFAAHTALFQAVSKTVRKRYEEIIDSIG